MRPAWLVLVITIAPLAGAEVPPPPAHTELPWLFGLDAVQVASSSDPKTSLPLDLFGEVDPTCSAASGTAIALHADVGPPAGVETIIGSYTHGILVFDAEARLVASAPGFPCTGSADELETLAVGTAWGTPVIAATIQTGGRRERMTWLGLYRVGRHGHLEATFSGTVEREQDGAARRGWIVLVPGGLIHREPTGEIVLWIQKPQGFYVPYSLARPHDD